MTTMTTTEILRNQDSEFRDSATDEFTASLDIGDIDFDAMPDPLDDFFDAACNPPPDNPPPASTATDMAETQPSGEAVMQPTDCQPQSGSPTGQQCDLATPDFATSTEATAVSRAEQIIGLEEQISRICVDEMRLKAQVKRLKDHRELLTEELDGLLSPAEPTEPNQPTALMASDVIAVGSGESAVGETSAGSVSRPQDWGREPIGALARHGLTEKKIETLQAAADAGRFDGTVRGLREWIAKSDLWYRDVKGCGSSGADKITDALTSYAAANPETTGNEPLTSADEKSSEAAAEYLGHKPATEQPMSTPTVKVEDQSGHATAKTEAMMSGSDPKAVEEAYLAGCEAGAMGASCADNPHGDRQSPQFKEWNRGWEECATAA